MEKTTEPNTHTSYCRQIIRECFWEYNMTCSEIVEMAQNGSDQEKKFLFAKIMENATDVLKSLSIFSTSDQKNLIFDYNAPAFKKNFLEKRHKIVKYFLTGNKVDIPELRWNI